MVIGLNVMIVGGDYIGKIEENLRGMGYVCVKHVTGRSRGDLRVVQNAYYIGIRILIVFTDFVSHKLAKEIKKIGKERGMVMVFCKRSWSCLDARMREIAR